MSIALLCPTRGRAVQFKRMCDSARATSFGDITIISASNGGDAYADNQFPINTPTVHMWNTLADRSKNKFSLYMLASDDIIFTTPGWDKALLDHYNSLENKIHVYAFLDSRDVEGTPHPIVSREYIDAMGYFLPPIFLHWFCDSWTVEIARANKCFTHLKDYMLIHDKPSDKGAGDETHWGIRRMGWADRDRYVNDKCQYILEFYKTSIWLNLHGAIQCGTFSDEERAEHLTKILSSEFVQKVSIQ